MERGKVKIPQKARETNIIITFYDYPIISLE